MSEDSKPVGVPAREVAYYDLDALIAQITDENRHDEILTGLAVGEEFS